jgi:hypothetical protein
LSDYIYMLVLISKWIILTSGFTTLIIIGRKMYLLHSEMFNLYFQDKLSCYMDYLLNALRALVIETLIKKFLVSYAGS